MDYEMINNFQVFSYCIGDENVEADSYYCSLSLLRVVVFMQFKGQSANI